MEKLKFHHILHAFTVKAKGISSSIEISGDLTFLVCVLN
jgi:hypothetical protein